MAQLKEFTYPGSWYVIAGMLALCGLGMCGLLWISASLHPAEFPVTVDYVVVLLAAGLFGASAGCVRIGIAFARKEPWTSRVLFGVTVVIVLVGLAQFVALALALWGWIAR